VKTLDNALHLVSVQHAIVISKKKLDTESHSQGIAPRNNIIICFMFLSSILISSSTSPPLLLLLLNILLLLLLLLLSYMMISSTSSLPSNKLSTQNILFCSPRLYSITASSNVGNRMGERPKRTRENLCKP
jgi:high-affinity Fe2+/Pb2+ permease